MRLSHAFVATCSGGRNQPMEFARQRIDKRLALRSMGEGATTFMTDGSLLPGNALPWVRSSGAEHSPHHLSEFMQPDINGDDGVGSLCG
jgi:hypothetical protein